MRRFLLFTLFSCFIIAIGFLLWTREYPNTLPGFQSLGAGEPLAQSSSSINVLEEAQPLVEEDSSSPTTTVQITTPTPQPRPAEFDKTSAQLGTTLALLLSSWPQGGILPHQLANSAANLADATGQPAVAKAAAALRSATPREGPATISYLMVEVNQALTLAPPQDLPVDAASAEASKSWFRQQLEKIITIRSPETQNNWSTSLLTVQQQIARGAVVDARQALTSKPLSADGRLDNLRNAVETYIAQSGRLNNLVTTYVNTFLLEKDGAE
ncbi:MAG: hypothetical protein GC129_01830 [Proteobacteria bacterium]|nr:hypothetical protein [Pseudomonadota bacterium]